MSCSAGRASVMSPSAPVYLVLASSPLPGGASYDAAGADPHAQRFFRTRLRTAAAGYILVMPDGEPPGERAITIRQRTAEDLELAEEAERRAGGGLVTLARRCQTVLVVGRESPVDRLALRLAAILASVLLGPIVDPRTRRCSASRPPAQSSTPADGASDDELVEALAHEHARHVGRAIAAVAEARDEPLDGALGLALALGVEARALVADEDRRRRARCGRRPCACRAKIASRMRRRCCGKTPAGSTFWPGWSSAHAAMALMSCRRQSLRLDLHVEEPLDLDHHLLVGLLVVAA